MAEKHIQQPGSVQIISCTINGIESGFGNYKLHEFRIFEDHCKPYFTGQMVIETAQNFYDYLLKPAVDITIVFHCPVSRPSSYTARTYSQKFRLHSYESRPIPQKHGQNKLIHTLSLITQEYHNDKHNTVTENHSNQTGTSAAGKIYNKYLKFERGLNIPVPSSGMIGQQKHANQTINKKPIKAINDILDESVWQQWKSCAPTFFKRSDGHMIAPQEYLLTNGPMSRYSFKQTLGSAARADLMFDGGYNEIITIKPMAPAGEISSGVRASSVGGLQNAASHLDLLSGTTDNLQKQVSKITNALKKNNFFKGNAGAFASATNLLKSASKGQTGARNLFSVINQTLRSRSIQKTGPGGYNTAQEALVTALTYATKYWVVVPGQTGNWVTPGNRIQVSYPVPKGNDKIQVRTKTLYVARLIHEVKLSDPMSGKPVELGGSTELFCVDW